MVILFLSKCGVLKIKDPYPNVDLELIRKMLRATKSRIGSNAFHFLIVLAFPNYILHLDGPGPL